LIWLSVLAFFAGLVDSVVGGGGLIQLPALLVFLPPELSREVAHVLGTNKAASICGTGMAVLQYAPRVEIPWRTMLPAAVAACAAAFFGAMTVSVLSGAALQPVVLVLLVAVAVYTLFKPGLGHLHAPAFTAHRERSVGILVGAGLGFYDGFFGPGMGSFLIFTFVGLLGFDFLRASASAKVVNFATNLAALALFAGTGHVLYQYAAPMALCQIAGSVTGTRIAMARGNRFVRVLFLVVSGALIVRFGWDVLRGAGQ
jgi:uncharacterized membrane protein YfcA